MSVVDPIVAVAQGTLRGTMCNGVMSFKGIPYAAPPRAHRVCSAKMP